MLKMLTQKPPPGKNPRSWGTSFWVILHVAFYDQTWQNYDVKQVHRIMPHVLPCSTCRQNHVTFRKEVESNCFRNPDEWANAAHNFVNKMHNRPLFSQTQCIERTQVLYLQPWLWINAFFKMFVFLISHYQKELETPSMIQSFCQLLYFDPVVKEKIENVTLMEWGDDAESKLALLKRVHQIHSSYAKVMCVPPFAQYTKWITEASYGDWETL